MLGFGELLGQPCADWHEGGGLGAQAVRKSLVKEYDPASLAAGGSNGRGKMGRSVPENTLLGVGVGQEVEVGPRTATRPAAQPATRARALCWAV